MNTIIIVTNNSGELTNFGLKLSKDSSDSFKELQNNASKILIVNNFDKQNEVKAKIEEANAIAEPKLLLKHNDFIGSFTGPIFDVKTGGAVTIEGSDRYFYEKLLNATDKFSVFDTIWDYFSKKNDKEARERNKTDFLYYIYNGGKPSEFSSKKQIPNIETFKSLYEPFEQEKYQKQQDLDDDESKGADQRQKLILLRDALLANK